MLAGGCSSSRGGAQSASPAPSVVPSPARQGSATPSIADTVVTTGNVDDVLRSVKHSALPRGERTAFVRFFAANRGRPSSYNGKTVRQIVMFQTIYEHALKTVAATQAAALVNSKKLGALIDARIVSARAGARAITFTIVLRNKTTKTIKHTDLNVSIADAQERKQLGQMELSITHAVPSHATVTVDMPISYRLFDNAEPGMRAAATHKKTYVVRLDRIEFADGTDAGLEESD